MKRPGRGQMPRFKHYNSDQAATVVINYQEQLQPGTFEHGVHYLIEHKLNLSAFHPRYRNDDTGRFVSPMNPAFAGVSISTERQMTRRNEI